MATGGAPFDALSSLNPDTFTGESCAVINFLADYYRDVDTYPVQPEAMPGCLRTLLPDAPPENGEQMDVILEEVWRHIVPALTHWQSPKFFGYFQANASTAGFAGETLSTGLNVVPFTRAASPVATELEGVVMDWMGKLVGLPDRFLFFGGGGGVLHGSTCEAVVCTLAKGARIVGIPRSNFRVIRTSAASGYGLTAASVRDAVEADVASGLVPLYLCATVGTTGLGAVDPVRDLGELARRHGIWLHVDAAYAGSALICPEFQHHIDGAELADSVSMNPHKWFLTNMDCCCLWVASPAALTTALSTNPEYLSNITEESAGAGVVDYKDWQIPLSRPFRAMKLWSVLRRYGGAGMRAYVRRHVEMAKWFEQALEADGRFEVVAPTRFSLVTFRLRPRHEGDDDAVDGLNRRLLVAVNASGRAFMTHFVVDGKFVIRMAVGGAMTEMRHVQDTWELVRKKAEEVGALQNERNVR
ncbi:tyrosine decarboxylase 1-like [Triticum aestivum]|uniref:tyrosine decarboxylase 1-like n=1 Tax=Triticum aestivum TaxID=4565 RepID=UPI001D0082FB|nr:tyrosine decarboxylase 1-like [Triticum aestivum]